MPVGGTRGDRMQRAGHPGKACSGAAERCGRLHR